MPRQVRGHRPPNPDGRRARPSLAPIDAQWNATNRAEEVRMGFIEIEQAGKRYQAEYSLDENVVTMFGERGRESTQLGGMTEQQVAKMLLRSLIRKGHIDPVDSDDR